MKKQNLPLTDRVIEEIVECATIRGQRQEPLDCAKAYKVFLKTYHNYEGVSLERFPSLRKQRTDYAFSVLRDYMWFDENTMEDLR